jgi:type 1 glutamine amidotransferase
MLATLTKSTIKSGRNKSFVKEIEDGKGVGGDHKVAIR